MPDNNSAPIRGAIRIQINNSTSLVAAGDKFSIFVTIQNPFEVPLKIRKVSSHIPTELVDFQEWQRHRQITKLQRRIADIDGTPVTFTDRVLRSFPTITQVGIGPFSFALELPSGTQAVAQEITSPDRNATHAVANTLPAGAPPAERRTQLATELSALQTEPTIERELQPGNSTTRVFTLYTRRTVWFTPSTYKLQIEVEYEFEGKRNIDTIEHELQVNASFLSIIFGAVLGSVGGWYAREFSTDQATTNGSTSWLVSLTVSVVLAIMACVLFARKKDVQPIIAVEDFWGGVAIGFLTGYVGSEFLDPVLPPNAPSTPPGGTTT